MRTPILLVALALPDGASALGGGYTHELHQVEFEGHEQRGVKAEYPLHRVTILDTSGILGTLLASGVATAATREVTHSPGQITEVWTAQYRPASAGFRVLLEYAWLDAEVDVQEEGSAVGRSRAEYTEFRLAAGGLVPLSPMYVDFNGLDLIWRDLTGAGRIDQFAWELDTEVGLLYGPLRGGVLGEVELVSLVDWAFEDAPLGYAYGLAGHFDLKPLLLSVRWREYVVPTGFPGGRGEGRSLSFGGSLEFL